MKILQWIGVAIGLIILIFLFPPASAGDDFTLSVLDNTSKDFTAFDQAGITTYTFSLDPDLFNFSDVYTNDSLAIWQASLSAEIIEEGDISTSNSYLIEYQYNNTWSASTRFIYTPQSFGYWNLRYEFLLTNSSIEQFQCTGEETNWYGAKMRAPNPRFSMNYELSGRYASNPMVVFFFDDSIIKGRVANFCSSPIAVGGGLQFVQDHLSSPPVITVVQADTQLYVHQVSYLFDTKQGEQGAQERFNAENAQGCEQTFIIFGVCDITGGALKAIGFVLGFVQGTQDLFLKNIPYIGGLFAAILIPIDLAFQLTAVVLNLSLTSNTTHSIADVYWMHVVYAASIGAIIAGFTGNILHFIFIPFYFVYWTLKGIFWVFYVLYWWLPIKIWEIIVAIVNAFIPG